MGLITKRVQSSISLDGTTTKGGVLYLQDKALDKLSALAEKDGWTPLWETLDIQVEEFEDSTGYLYGGSPVVNARYFHYSVQVVKEEAD